MKGDAIAGRYRVDRVLGSGSSGFVVAARHAHTREKVALKVLTNGAEPAERSLPPSPHIARVIETGYTQERQAFIATELLDGETLAEVALRGPVSPHLAVSWIRQACEGLAAAHAAGITHGDLKPANLLLTNDGVVKLVDFGMQMVVEDQHESAAWLASPAYLSPEQLREATFDARADVWALGVILHELIAGELPFQAGTIAGMFVAVAYEEPKPLIGSDVPDGLAKVVHACLAKIAPSRPSVRELAEMLAPFAPAESMAPQLAMTLEEPPSEESPLASRDLDAPTPRSRAESLAPAIDTHADQDFRRRRWGAIAVVGAAALLGVVGLSASPSAASEPPAAMFGSTSPRSEVTAEPAEVAEAPRTFGLGAFVPPSFALPEPREEADTQDRAPTPPAALPVRWTPPLRPRPRLLVRDDPYLRPIAAPKPVAAPPAAAPHGGFTHPRQLPERKVR